MRFMFVIFSILVLAACGKGGGNSQAPSDIHNADFSSPVNAGTSDIQVTNNGSGEIDAQTKRVVGDPLLASLLTPFTKKYNVVCAIPLSQDDNAKNPRWTCLNNMACSYRIAINCFDKKDNQKQTMSFVATGFDDGNDPRIQDLAVTYSN